MRITQRWHFKRSLGSPQANPSIPEEFFFEVSTPFDLEPQLQASDYSVTPKGISFK